MSEVISRAGHAKYFCNVKKSYGSTKKSNNMSLIKSKNNGNLPKVFSDFFDNDRFFSNRWLEKEFTDWIPSANIRENGKQFTIEVEAPGFAKNDIKVNVEDDVLTISAEKQEEKKEENERYTRKEFTSNSFSRSFTLPANADSGKIEAKYENGILKLALPKKEETRVSARREIRIS